MNVSFAWGISSCTFTLSGGGTPPKACTKRYYSEITIILESVFWWLYGYCQNTFHFLDFSQLTIYVHGIIESQDQLRSWLFYFIMGISLNVRFNHTY